MSTIADQKQILRKQIRAQRHSFEGPAQEKQDRSVFQQITHHQLYQNAHTICIYVSMDDEVDTHVLIDEILFNGEKRLVVPKIEGGIINLYEIESYDDLEKGTIGILEPKKSCTKVALKEVDLCIVPGVAFGLDGSRIGMGKGYYDRLLKSAHVPTIGIAYSFQVFDFVPTTPDDYRLDLIIKGT